MRPSSLRAGNAPHVRAPAIALGHWALGPFSSALAGADLIFFRATICFYRSVMRLVRGPLPLLSCPKDRHGERAPRTRRRRLRGSIAG